MEPKTEKPISPQMHELANNFVEQMHINRDETRIQMREIFKNKYIEEATTTAMNRQGLRNKIIILPTENNKLEFKYMALMLADDHFLFIGWTDEYKSAEFNKILKMKITDYESHKADSEIKTDEELAHYKEFQENLQKLIPPPPAEVKPPEEYRKIPGVVYSGRRE